MVVDNSFFRKHSTGVDLITPLPNLDNIRQGKFLMLEDSVLQVNEVFVLNTLARLLYNDERRWVDLYHLNLPKPPGDLKYGDLISY